MLSINSLRDFSCSFFMDLCDSVVFEIGLIDRGLGGRVDNLVLLGKAKGLVNS